MKLKHATLLFLAILLGITTFSDSVSAVSTPNRSLSISPLRREVDIPAGTSYTNSIAIKNSGKNELVINLNAEVFSVTNQAYDYAFDATNDTAKWVRFSPNSFALQPGEQQRVDYVVSVPIGAEPGGRYISLFASSRPASDSSGIAAVERLASLLYITVPGDITRTGSVLSLRSPLVVFSRSSWSVSVKNSGSTHFRSVYDMTIHSLFGSTISSSNADALILPSSIRLISGDIPQPTWIGIYKLDFAIGLGDTPAYRETRWILNAPPLQLLLVSCGIGGLALLLLAWRKNHRQKQKTK